MMDYTFFSNASVVEYTVVLIQYTGALTMADKYGFGTWLFALGTDHFVHKKNIISMGIRPHFVIHRRFDP